MLTGGIVAARDGPTLAKYSLKAVQMLVEKGADINAKDDAGFTALHWAREMEQQDIVEFLKKKGAKE